MRKLAVILLVTLLLVSCGPKQQKVERYMEDGVEVVVNHIEPYKIKGEPSNLVLEEEFTIDTERDEITKVGLNDIWMFDVDSERNIYIRATRVPEYLVYKFDKNGNFVRRFGRKGQGPGEFQSPSFLIVTSQDEIAVSDSMKIVIFSKDGNLIKEIRKEMYKKFVTPLKNGNYLAYFVQSDLSDEAISYYYCLRLYNSEFDEIKEIDRIASRTPTKRFKGVDNFIYTSVSKDRIYVGNNEKKYEIYVYDLEGNLVRKIKKKYRKVPVTKEYKKKVLKVYEHPDNIASKKYLYFPKHMPPFHKLFSDDEGRLFVQTNEKGKHSQEYIHDIFNPDGLFIGRICLKTYGFPIISLKKAKSGYLYCLRMKESGYKELVVYKMSWE